MKKIVLFSILVFPFLSVAQIKMSNTKSAPTQSKIQNKNKSISKNIFMFAPAEEEHELLLRLIFPTGTISGPGIDAKLSGYFSNFQYAYGISDQISLGASQSLLNEYKISSNTGDIKYSGIGDTSIFAKYFIPINNIDFYISSQYQMALLEKSKNNYDTNEFTRVAERNNLSLDFGANFKFDIFSFGGLLLYKYFQSGETEVVSSGLSYTESTDSGSAHELSLYSQLNLENLKLGLSLTESVENEYSGKRSPGTTTIKYSASTIRTIMLYSIIPLTDNLEGHFAAAKFEPKEKNNFTYNYYTLMAALRLAF